MTAPGGASRARRIAEAADRVVEARIAPDLAGLIVEVERQIGGPMMSRREVAGLVDLVIRRAKSGAWRVSGPEAGS